ncbi:MAG: hypothetical protein U0894_14940 [Pirellulales bacterium]
MNPIFYKYSVEIILNLVSFILALLLAIFSYVFFPDPTSGNIGAYVSFWIALFVTLCMPPWLLTIKMAIDVADVQKRADENHRLISDAIKLLNDHRHTRDIDEIWAGANELIRVAGRMSQNDHSAKFLANEHGFEVTGEEWSLSGYQRVWEQLVEFQKRIQSENSGRCIVARITHSNDIDIWNENGKAGASRAESLLDLQENFIKHGGVIVRLLLYQGEQPGEIYESVAKRMQSIGIESRLCELKSDDEARFDFLWACLDEKNDEMHCVVKWFPGTGGLRLAGCEITDIADDEVRRLWRLFGGRSERKDGPFKHIPATRITT